MNLDLDKTQLSVEIETRTRSPHTFATSLVLHGLGVLVVMLLGGSSPPDDREAARLDITDLEPVTLVSPPPELHAPPAVRLPPQILLPPRPERALLPPAASASETPDPEALPAPSAPSLKTRQVRQRPMAERPLPRRTPVPKPKLRVGLLETVEAGAPGSGGERPALTLRFSRALSGSQASPSGGSPKTGLFEFASVEPGGSSKNPGGARPSAAAPAFSPHQLALQSPPRLPAAGRGAGKGDFGQATARRGAVLLGGGKRIAAAGFAIPRHGVGGGTRGGDGAVLSGGFSEATVAKEKAGGNTSHAEPSRTPVRILNKPRPGYSEEARLRGIEGLVVLRVRFLRTGVVQVLRVESGLGYGLDQKAVEAARSIRFEPATVNQRPVDSSATVHLTFELAS